MVRFNSLFASHSITVILSALALATPGPTAAQGLDEPPDRAAVRVVARLEVANAGEPVRSSSTTHATLRPGESGELRVGAQDCNVFAGGLGGAPAGGVVWHLAVTLDEVDWDQFTLSYGWSRTDADSGAAVSAIAEEHGRLRLRHGESVPIDMARIRRPDAASCDVLVHLEADYAGVAELRHRTARHDVWLLHTDPDGAETSTRLNLTGEQGEALSFLFDPLTLELPSAEESKEARVTVRVSGRLRTWQIAGDTLMMVVDTETSMRSTVGTVFAGSAGSGQGTKRFLLRPGEAVKIVLPPFAGAVRLPGADPLEPLPAGFERRGDVIALDSEEAFGGHGFALVIQASVGG